MHTPPVRTVGTLLVILAVGAVQVPLVACPTTCQADIVTAWDLALHDCHDDRAPEHHHGCLGHDHACGGHPEQPCDEGEDEDAGDHDLVTATLTLLDLGGPLLAQPTLVAVTLIDAALPPRGTDVTVRPSMPEQDPGPPGGLDSDRLIV